MAFYSSIVSVLLYIIYIIYYYSLTTFWHFQLIFYVAEVLSAPNEQETLILHLSTFALH